MNKLTKVSARQTSESEMLSPQDHSRDSAHLTYVYPVVSRRAGGVSIGINLNPNNACNWQCIYCQVPDLKRGQPPAIDLLQLEKELRLLLDDLVHGNFMQRRVPENMRRIEDLAFSGNGEPTSAPEFGTALEIVARLREEYQLDTRIRLITNGSLINRPAVQTAIARLGALDGEVWFKLDGATRESIKRINQVDLDPAGVLERLILCAERCSTWIQTCCFTLDGQAPSPQETQAWLDLLAQALTRMSHTGENPAQPEKPGGLHGVHLYGLARPSMQGMAERLGPVSAAWLNDLANRVAALGLSVKIST